MAEVVLENLHFRYPGSDEDTLLDLDLTIANGSAHALLGASGAGKTTILNLLSGLLQPSTGDIRFDGKSVAGMSPADRNVALVFQFPVLYESASVLKNLTIPLLNRGTNRSEAKNAAEAIAAELGVGDQLTRKAGELSLFQKQLVCIGKALVRNDVDLILLDEPLTAVEPSAKWQLRQVLSRVQAEHGTTMVYVTHDQKEALTFADNVSVMADGRILQTGSPDEIYGVPANTRVARFIGSPGMQFVEEAISAGRPLDLAYTGAALDVPDAYYQLGTRSEWITVEPGGEWTVLSSQLRGTTGGMPLHLLTLGRGDDRLTSEAAGHFPTGSDVNIRINRCVLFEDGRAVAHG